jgi:hypothetical protein
MPMVLTVGVQAGPDSTFLGALAGAGAGLVLSHNVSGVHREWAVPALALAGGWMGHEWDRRRETMEFPGQYDTVLRLREPPLQIDPPSADNLHPGVILLKISIRTTRGLCRDVNVLRLGDRFIGPQGEVYVRRPTPDELAVKYGK